MKTAQIIYGFVLRHEAVSLLLFTAAVNSMPKTLPPIRKAHEWVWGWGHDTLKLFVNYRNPAQSGQTNPQEALDEHF